MLGKRLINTTVAGAAPSCTTDTLQILGDSSCIAYYKMSDATDESGSYDGTPTSVNFNVAGKFGNAGKFNGGASYVNLNSAVLPASVFSISIWINLNSLSTGWLFSQYTGGVTGRFVFNVTATGGFQINVSSTNSLSTTNIPVITTGNWHHVVVVKDGSNGWKLYADGQYHSAWNDTQNIITNQNTILGGDDSVTSSNMVGSIDQVRIFNTALSSTEVTTLYDEVDCPCTTNTIDYPTSNVAYYEFDGNAEDSTTNGYNGADSNVTWAQGRYGTVASFNGSNSVITIPNIKSQLDGGVSFTISCWVNVSSSQSGEAMIINTAGSSSVQGVNIGVQPTSGLVYFQIKGNNNLVASGTTNLVGAGWKNIVLTHTNSSTILYVNGIEEANTGANTIGTMPNDLTLGKWAASSLYYLNGSIDQVRIFSSELSSTDVADLYDEQYCFDNFFNDDSTVATYKLNNTPFDDLGHYNGTASNVTYATGKFDKAAVFNGSGSAITTSLDFNTLTDYSISLWLNPTGGAFFGGTINSAAKNGFYFQYSSTVPNTVYWVELNASAVVSNLTITGAVNTGWNHIVFVRNGGTNYIYVNNGTPVSVSNGSHTHAEDFILGQAGAFTASPITGQIDQVRIFDRALSSGEVTQLKNE